MPLSIKPGDIFTWDDFPLHDDPSCTDKRRWFIHLGKTSALSDPVFLIILTPTTQTAHYESGGSRSRNDFLDYPQGTCGFPQRSILDLTNNLFKDATEQLLIEADNVGKIAIVSRMTNDRMQQLWNRLKSCSKLSRIEKRDMLRSLLDAGFIGLKDI